MGPAGKGVAPMKLTIEGDTKEITALVLALQERRFDEETASKIIAHLQEQQSQNKQIWQPTVDYAEYFPNFAS